MSAPEKVSLFERLYDSLTTLLPPTLRHSPYRRDLVLTAVRLVQERRRRRGPWAAVTLGSWLVVELLGRSLALRLPERRHRHGGGPRRVPAPRIEALSPIPLGARVLRRHPAYTVAAIGTLALGIGAALLIATVVRGVLLRPLPFDEPRALVAVWLEFRGHGATREIDASEPEYLELQEQSQTFAELAAYWLGSADLGGLELPIRVQAASVGAGFLPMLGIEAEVGRVFAAGEDRPGAERVVLLSYGLWRRTFGGDLAIIGSTLRVNGRTATIVGVLPREFRFPGAEQVELLRPAVIDPESPEGRSSHFVSMIGRLRAGLDVTAAQREVDTLMERWTEEFPERHGPSENHPLVISELKERIVGDSRPALALLLAAVALALLAATVNVTSVTVARGTKRLGELRVRKALGAGTRQLATQILLESMLLAGAGGLAALLLVVVGLPILLAAAPAELPRLADISVDATVVMLAAVISVGAGIAMGVVASITALGSLRSASSPAERANAVWRSTHRGLIVSQVALALVLSLGAGLLLKSYHRLSSVDPGFRSDGVLAFDLRLNGTDYPDQASVATFWQRLQKRLAAVHGVVDVGALRDLPLRSSPGHESLRLPGLPEPTHDDLPWNAQLQVADPGALQALGLTARSGRLLESRDGAEAPPVVLINQTFALLNWPDSSPLGRQVQVGRFPGNQNPEMTIVGIIEDVAQDGLDRPAPAQIIVPRQQAGAIYDGFATRAATVTVRLEGDPVAAIPALRSAVAELDPGLPLAGVDTLRGVLSGSIARERFAALVLSILGIAGLVLGVSGVAGLLGLLVAQRTFEIGVRMALGASPGRVWRAVVREGLMLTLLGCTLGAALSWAAGGVVTDLLFRVPALDAGVYVGCAALLMAAAMAAAAVPARRAARLDPVRTMQRDGGH